MVIELSAHTLVTAGAVISAIGIIGGVIVWAVRFVDKQRAQDKEIQAIKEEQTILVYGVLACLKGLRERGCNGPVTKAIEKMERHLNVEAHK